MIARLLQPRVVVENRVENVEEKVERILVEEVDLAERVQREEDAAARFRQGPILLRHRLDLTNHLIRLLYLLADLRSLLLQRFERSDDRVVV